MEMDLLYRLWVNILCGHNPAKIHKIIKCFGSAEMAYKADKMPANERVRISDLKFKDKSLDDAKKIADNCAKAGIKIITIDSGEYPKRLKHSSYPPQLLYVKGNMPDLNSLVTIGVVGTRKATKDGAKFVRSISADVVRCGVAIISGMARGIDTAAHLGALDAGGVTVCVLAGGVDVVYPKCNRDIYNSVCKSGAIVSEQPPGTIGRPEFYQDRNRIIAGLSNGVLVGEATMKTGVIHTVNAAFEENRDVFAIPGSPYKSESQYPNYLLQNGAKLVNTAEDILSEYINVYVDELENGLEIQSRIKAEHPDLSNLRIENAEIKEKADEGKTPDMSLYEKYQGNERIVLEYLCRCGGEAHIDVISVECGISMVALNSTLIVLQMRNLVKQKPGNHFYLT